MEGAPTQLRVYMLCITSYIFTVLFLLWHSSSSPMVGFSGSSSSTSSSSSARWHIPSSLCSSTSSASSSSSSSSTVISSQFLPGVALGTPQLPPQQYLSPLPYTTCSALAARGLGEYSEQDLEAHMRGQSHPTTGAWNHQAINASCPRYVQNDVSAMAGLGHRLSNWLCALATALHYQATFVHDFEEAPGVHGNYFGWVRELGLGMGGNGSAELAWKQGLRERVGVGEGEGGGVHQVVFPPTEVQYPDRVRNHHVYTRQWGAKVLPCGDSTSSSGVSGGGGGTVYRLGGDNWPYDFTSRVKGVVASKFLAASRSPAPGWSSDAGGVEIPRFPRTLRWEDPSQVIIAVHVRKGDVYSVPEDMLARMVSETVVPALVGEGFPLSALAVHVFAEFRGYGAEAFPTLGALAQGVGFEGKPLGGPLKVVFWDGTSSSGGGGDGSLAAGQQQPPTEWDTFFHLGGADFVVTSQSGFPSMATLFSLHPLTLGFPSSNTLKHCRGDITCCYYDGRCSFSAITRVRARARMLKQADSCGLLKGRRRQQGGGGERVEPTTSSS